MEDVCLPAAVSALVFDFFAWILLLQGFALSYECLKENMKEELRHGSTPLSYLNFSGKVLLVFLFLLSIIVHPDTFDKKNSKKASLLDKILSNRDALNDSVIRSLYKTA